MNSRRTSRRSRPNHLTEADVWEMAYLNLETRVDQLEQKLVERLDDYLNMALASLKLEIIAELKERLK